MFQPSCGIRWSISRSASLEDSNGGPFCLGMYIIHRRPPFAAIQWTRVFYSSATTEETVRSTRGLSGLLISKLDSTVVAVQESAPQPAALYDLRMRSPITHLRNQFEPGEHVHVESRTFGQAAELTTRVPAYI
jgi:hypothetical protein